MGRSKGLLLVALAALLCACKGSGSGGPAFNLEALKPFAGVSDWSMAGGGPTHSGYVPVTLDASHFSPRWSVILPKGNTEDCKDPDGFYHCVFIYQAVTDSADRRVVVKTDTAFGSQNTDYDDFKVIGLDEDTGSIVWSTGVSLQSDPEEFVTHEFSDPSVFNGKVYFSAYMNDQGISGGPVVRQVPRLYVFDAKSGARLLSMRPPCVPSCVYEVTQAVVSDSTLYAGSPLTAYVAGTGVRLWTAVEFGSDPSLDAGAIYVSSSETSAVHPVFTALDTASGSQLFQITGANELGAITAPVLDGMGGAVVGRLGTETISQGSVPPVTGYLDHYSLTTHARDWQVKGEFGAPDQIATAKGVVYVCDGNAVDALDVSDGTRLWSWTPLGDDSLGASAASVSHCSLVVTDNLLFVSSANASYAVDLATRAVQWSYPAGGILSISPSGLLYISANHPYPVHLVAINLH